MKAEYFCERRELGIINIGGNARIMVDGTIYEPGFKEALYITQGSIEIVLESMDTAQPALLYLNSAPAHKAFSNKLIKQSNVNVIDLGNKKDSNKRRIKQFIVASTCET